MSVYSKEFIVPYYDTDIENKLKTEMILAYMAETSSWHVDSLGIGYDILKDNNFAWLLNRWEVNISKHPKAKERIKVYTWTTEFNKFYAFREFKMTLHNGEEIARASTIWIFVDSTTKKPKRIPEAMVNIFSKSENKMVERVIDFKKSFTLPYSNDKKIIIRKSDIDNNNHVNNVKYLEWLIESTDDKLLKTHSIKDISIEYKKEVLLGDTPIVSSYIREIKNGIIINYKISTRKTDNVFAQLELEVK